MSTTITLPNEIENQLQRRAEKQHRSIEELAIEILQQSLSLDENFPTPEEVVAKIQATPPNPQNIRPATGSLEEVLRTQPEDPDFDLETWKHNWSAVEDEMHRVTRANNKAEGRS